ncbi:MAG TPA: hypothetical protein ENH00_09830 [Actinobacteria bacterium]|nr:hypothetical protein BMS3Bbin01_01386 [bacterium BMS3Bbin01]HDH26476.1 hypothetical protein [Actinomycetota bacterium]
MATVVRLGVQAVDGECIPVPNLEIGCRYKYVRRPSTWSLECTNGDGLVWFHGEHQEPPVEVDLFVGDQFCDTFPVEDGTIVVLEL